MQKNRFNQEIELLAFKVPLSELLRMFLPLMDKSGF